MSRIQTLASLIVVGLYLMSAQAWADPVDDAGKAVADEDTVDEATTDEKESTDEKEEAAVEEADAAAEDKVDVKQLVRQLNDDKFAVREEASRKLLEAGKQVIPALQEAAQSSEAEVVTRSFAILKQFVKKGDAETRTAARKALETIADGKSESAARRAEKLLAENQPANPAQNRFGIFGPGRIQLRGGGNIQIQVQAAIGGNGVKKITKKIANGVTEVDAQEGDTKVKIVDNPKTGIKMEVTTKKKGKEETKKYEAKSADELKKKHPEAHKLYDKYTGAGGLQINAAQIQVGPNGRIQIAPKKPRAAKAEKEDEDAEEATEAEEKDDDDAAAAVQKTVKELQKQAALRQAKDLEQAIKQLEELRERLKEQAGDSEE